MNSKKLIIHWFRQDLRITDNPSLFNASQQGIVFPIYILDDKNAKDCTIGAASKWWLYHSLQSLNKSLGGNLYLFKGNAIDIIANLVTENKISTVYWNRCYEPWRIIRDKKIKEKLQEQGVIVKTFNGSLLWEPWQILKSDSTPYKVFTPFYKRGCLNSLEQPRPTLPNIERLVLHAYYGTCVEIDKLNLLPNDSWYKKLSNHWSVGEKAAKDSLEIFLDSGVNDYKEGRNFPYKKNVSKLSPYLHFGEISPHQIWHAAKGCGDDYNVEHFCSELGWREFSYYLLYHFPHIVQSNFNPKFDKFSWDYNESLFNAWKKGKTGYPIVDAGMRELWETGYIHNRVRMIVASFLVKNLLISWHEGESWFWDCLVDADLANNKASWQWVAGCGADAAPYFRIFNPILQGGKFDKNGDYTRKWVPELSKVPNKYLFCPWEAPIEILNNAEVILGENYPYPVVDFANSRQKALEVFAQLKNSRQL